MSFLHIAIMVAILLGAMVASMLYYGSRGKKRMGIEFRALAEVLGGTVVQQNRMYYPHLSATVNGHPVELFFHLSEGHRKTSDFIYLVLSTPVAFTSSTLVVTEGFFTAKEDKGDFNEVAGDYLADMMPGRYIYATDEAATASLFRDHALAQGLAPFSRYANIVLGPDAITAGKPYGGAPDLALERLREDLENLVALSVSLEKAPAPPEATASAAG